MSVHSLTHLSLIHLTHLRERIELVDLIQLSKIVVHLLGGIRSEGLHDMLGVTQFIGNRIQIIDKCTYIIDILYDRE